MNKNQEQPKENKNHVFYTVIDKKMVYVTITTQDIPQNIPVIKGGYESKQDFLETIGKCIDDLHD